MEELDLHGALERLKPYGLSPIERVLAGHTGTVQLLLSLLLGEPVDVVLIGQNEIESRHEIHREVSLRLRDRGEEACRAVSVIDTQLNAQLVLDHIREGRLGLGQIAVQYSVPIKRTINTVEVDNDQLSREYTMESESLGHYRPPRGTSAPVLHYVITEMFPRELFRRIEW